MTIRHIFCSTFLSLILFSCEEKNETSEAIPEVPFEISFFVVDSMGNLVFPHNEENSSIYNPEDFYAYSMFSTNIGLFNAQQDFGHVFRIRESTSTILNNVDLWMPDSIIRFHFCFDNLCDSVIVYNPFYTDFTSSAEWIIWRGDTIYNYELSLLTYEINN